MDRRQRKWRQPPRHRFLTRTARGWVALLALFVGSAVARADELSVNVPATAAVTGTATAVFMALELTGSKLTPRMCHWCEPPGIDANTRLHLKWDDTRLANDLSTMLLVAVPASLMALDYFVLTHREFNRFGEDVLVVVEAVAVTAVATDTIKYAAARRRPFAWASGIRTSYGDDNSFVSGHSSATFAGAAAFGTLAMLRGYPRWPLIYVAGFAGATAVSYLRIAADKHWLTDVFGGAALGTAVGVALPLLLHRKTPAHDARNATIIVTPVPLGVAGTF